MTAPALSRISAGSSSETVSRLLAVCFPDAATICDATWGRGRFWVGSDLSVTGVDISPHGRPDVIGDFRHLPFRDETFDVAIFDPPYLTETGRDSLVAARFGSYPTIPALHVAVRRGALEAWRVSRLGVIVKVMDYCHASRLVRMTRWVEDAIPADLYDYVNLTSRSKPEDPKWQRVSPQQLSVRSNATTFLVWRKDGPIHKRRAIRQEAV